ncbi:MAG: hypothetical protein HN590_12825 [Calditrichaeota bacterium]|nr:hypothetical protein [Calditrichota bacterium]
MRTCVASGSLLIEVVGNNQPGSRETLIAGTPLMGLLQLNPMQLTGIL